MKIKPKSSELSRDDKLIRGIRNAINYFYADKDADRINMINSTKKEEDVWLRIFKNYSKLNEDTTEKP